jgi:hypothetical protein
MRRRRGTCMVLIRGICLRNLRHQISSFASWKVRGELHKEVQRNTVEGKVMDIERVAFCGNLVKMASTYGV